MNLRSNLLEHFDYEALPWRVYKYLKQWYGIDYEIVRYLKQDPIQRDQIFLDVYPECTALNMLTQRIKKNAK